MMNPGLLSRFQTMRCRWRVMRRGLARENGATMIEMALVLPVFLLTILGFFVFAIILSGYTSASLSCRAAARYASLGSSTSLSPATTASINAVVTTYLFSAGASTPTVNVAYNTANTIGNSVTVTVTLVYPISVPFLNISSVTVGSYANRVITR